MLFVLQEGIPAGLSFFCNEKIIPIGRATPGAHREG